MRRHLLLDAKYRPTGELGSAAGMQNATSGSPTDMLTRQHRMTVDEAMLILNLKRGESSAEKIKQACYFTCNFFESVFGWHCSLTQASCRPFAFSTIVISPEL